MMDGLKGTALWVGGFVCGAAFVSMFWIASETARLDEQPEAIPVNEAPIDGTGEPGLSIPIERRHQTWDAFSYRRSSPGGHG